MAFLGRGRLARLRGGGGLDEPVVAVGNFTGTGIARTVSGLPFKPDMLWIKGSGRIWIANDSVAVPPSANAHIAMFPQASYVSSANHITGFISGGFTVGTSLDVNASGATYTYYAFKFRRGYMHATAHTGNGSNPRNIAHNLGVAPSIMLAKSLSDTTTWPWYAYIDAASNGGAGFRIATDNAVGSADTAWLNNTAPTASVFTVGNTVLNTNTHYVTCWQFGNDNRNIKIGGYLGDGNANGPTITLPFVPKLIILKRPFTVGSYWGVFDAVNNTSSPWTKFYRWSGGDVQQTDANGIIVSGKTFRPPLTWNANAAGHTYMAWG